MKHFFLIGMLFLIPGALAAQNSNSGNSASQNAQNQRHVQTVRGCLSKTGNTYVLLGGTPMRQFRIIGGDIAAFRGKQNQVVEVTGIVGVKESGAATDGNYGPGSTTGVGYDTIIAQSVRVVEDDCGL